MKKSILGCLRKEWISLSPSHYFLPPEAYQVSHESGHPQGHTFPQEQVEQVSVVESEPEPEPEPEQPRHKEKQRQGKEPKKGGKSCSEAPNKPRKPKYDNASRKVQELDWRKGEHHKR